MNIKKDTVSLIVEALKTRFVENDVPALPEQRLKQAVKPSGNLSAKEQAAVLRSPMTLQRIQQLARQTQAGRQWQACEFIYRAAADASDHCSIDSTDGEATLHITNSRKGDLVTVKLSKSFLHQLQASGQKVSLTMSGVTLPYQTPNTCGELQWQTTQSLKPLLMQHQRKACLLLD